MHSYIDVNKVKDFSRDIEFMEIYDYVSNRLKNVAIDEYDDIFAYEIADTLHEDYIRGIANYQSYAEDGMDARMLMELRKSAILPQKIILDIDLTEMWKEHSTCETWKDVKRLRTKWFKVLNKDYKDADWQYLYLCRLCYKDDIFKYLKIDFECHYHDCRYNLEKDLDFIVGEATKAHLEGWSGYANVYGNSIYSKVPDNSIYSME